MDWWKKATLRGKDIKDTLKELETQIDMLQDDKEYYRRLYVENVTQDTEVSYIQLHQLM